MVGPGRLELPTSRLSGVRSNHLSYGPQTESGLIFWDRVSRRCLIKASSERERGAAVQKNDASFERRPAA
jgi:hypothetical protein